MKALFNTYTCKEDYEKAGVLFTIPMTAKEIESEEEQDRVLSSGDYYVEEKFDGTRATLHFFPEYIRCFSRRVSEKTGWFCENSDSLPHLRDLKFPELAGTIIDGEMFIPNRPFKDVASTLNCKWDKAVQRQEELGKIVFHAFDILYYKEKRVEDMPLYKRKELLQEVIDTVNSPYIKMVKYYSCDSLIPVRVGDKLKKSLYDLRDIYPHLFYDLSRSNKTAFSLITPRAYYEYIVATGGEGVVVKLKEGKYFYKRGWEYSKIKKFLTKDVIVMGFTEPTKEYNGKFPDPETWNYWEDAQGSLYNTSDRKTLELIRSCPEKFNPVSKYYFNNWVGNIRFGVIITEQEIKKLPKKKFNIENMTIAGKNVSVLEVGECSGFDEEQREIFSKSSYVGKVIEVKANEIFKDTGKLRHPRFLKMREDKSPLDCIWKDHINLEV